jgi:hypothetical protein
MFGALECDELPPNRSACVGRPTTSLKDATPVCRADGKPVVMARPGLRLWESGNPGILCGMSCSRPRMTWRLARREVARS